MGFPWRAERVWEGLPVVIVAGGESFSAAQARLIGIARSRGDIRVIAVNDAIYPCWFADIAYACDASWWRWHGPLPGFSGQKLCLEESVPFDDVGVLKNTGTVGFDPDPGALRSGGNSGYQAMHLAAHMGGRPLILVAFDHRGAHWFGDHPEGLRVTRPTFNARRDAFRSLKEAFDDLGISVVNASERTALDVFKCGVLQVELRKAAEYGEQRKAAR